MSFFLNKCLSSAARCMARIPSTAGRFEINGARYGEAIVQRLLQPQGRLSEICRPYARRLVVCPDPAEGATKAIVDMVTVKLGDRVERNSPLCILQTVEGLKGRSVAGQFASSRWVSSRLEGIVTKVHKTGGSVANVGEPLVEIETDDGHDDVKTVSANVNTFEELLRMVLNHQLIENGDANIVQINKTSTSVESNSDYQPIEKSKKLIDSSNKVDLSDTRDQAASVLTNKWQAETFASQEQEKKIKYGHLESINDKPRKNASIELKTPVVMNQSQKDILKKKGNKAMKFPSRKPDGKNPYNRIISFQKINDGLYKFSELEVGDENQNDELKSQKKIEQPSSEPQANSSKSQDQQQSSDSVKETRPLESDAERVSAQREYGPNLGRDVNVNQLMEFVDNFIPPLSNQIGLATLIKATSLTMFRYTRFTLNNVPEYCKYDVGLVMNGPQGPVVYHIRSAIHRPIPDICRELEEIRQDIDKMYKGRRASMSVPLERVMDGDYAVVLKFSDNEDLSAIPAVATGVIDSMVRRWWMGSSKETNTQKMKVTWNGVHGVVDQHEVADFFDYWQLYVENPMPLYGDDVEAF